MFSVLKNPSAKICSSHCARLHSLRFVKLYLICLYVNPSFRKSDSANLVARA